jgi:c-di-AMP phosphodiesterase-like protein
MNISKSAIPEMIELFSNVSIIKGKYIFSEFENKTKLPDDVISQFANILLNFRGIEASFVIARNTNNRVKVSARSKGNVNVQDIMQKIGGGGHYDIAAASFPVKTSIKSIATKIKKIVRGL